MLRVTVIGGAGRMGRALVACAREFDDLQVVAVVGQPDAPELGRDAGEMAGIGATGPIITQDLAAALAMSDVAIDFSSARATRDHVDQCALARVPLVLGTTGLPENLAHDFARAAERIPLLVAPNTSLGVTVLLDLVQRAARALPAEFDIEIVEAHHRHKVDAPSGTALALGHAAAGGRDASLDDVAVHARAGEGARQKGEIGFAVVRGGDIVGEHEVIFAGAGEQVVLAHRATDRSIFARGALEAARWLAKQRPGRYAMRHVLGLDSDT